MLASVLDGKIFFSLTTAAIYKQRAERNVPLLVRAGPAWLERPDHISGRLFMNATVVATRWSGGDHA